ncbi:COGs protein [Vibrio ishigakensis]|uniref:COGs protein n=1 Tax=Vibrio ishigakensis TaxID=1481914 RepID=A0A0B8QA71_9VIBR|nr:COGs protein [Vibrio ishigakensis]
MESIKRLQLIEVCLLWEGGVNARILQDYYSISRTTAQRHIDDYKTHYPQNVAGYDGQLKRHLVSEEFTPQVTRGNLNEYLSFFGTDHDEVFETTVDDPLNIELLPKPTRNIDPRLIRSVIKACKSQLRLDIGYFSVSSGVNESRIISPHSIVFDGIRWHTRAWCERSQLFKDFVLSRFNDVPVFEGGARHFKKDDTEWNNYVELILQPDPRLSDAKRYSIELDYRMNNGVLVISCRAALIKYLIQNLRLDAYNQNPEGQQIIVEPHCWVALEPYRFKR